MPPSVSKCDLRSFERSVIKCAQLPHLQWGKDARKREKKILQKRSEELDIDAKKRKDYTQLTSYAIDSKTAQIREDAVSYDWRNSRVLVHIADPTAYFPKYKQDPIIREALKRGETMYVNKGCVLHMFPCELNSRRLALTGAQSRVPALAFVFSVRKDGSIRSSTITVRPSYIKMKEMSYEDVDSEIRKGKNKDLIKLQEVASAINNFRLRKKSTSKPLVSPSARVIVSELMMAANIAAGKYAVQRKIFVLFRKQEGSSPAKHSITPGEHKEGGYPVYTNVTSPLRKGTDLVSHMQLKAYKRHEKLPFRPEKLLDKKKSLQKVKREIKGAGQEINTICRYKGYQNCHVNNKRMGF